MAHFHVKTKKGRPYLYVREIARVNGKPKVISQTYIGTPEKVAGLVRGRDEDVVTLKVEEFGALWLSCEIDRDIDLCGLIDRIVARADRETGPSIGEYFLYGVLNRMVHAVSKNKLASWYRSTAIQHIRPVGIDELTSQRYWEKWDRVSEADLRKIANAFFERIWHVEAPSADCLLFDTTTYSTYFAQDLAATPLERFEPVDTPGNRQLMTEGKHAECLLAYRTRGDYWGKERAVIVTYNPASHRKQEYTFNDKLEAMRQQLLSMRAKVRDKAPLWRNEDAVRQRYLRLCVRMHMPHELYELTFTHSQAGLSMNFRKNAYLVGRKQAMFGKSVIITDNTDWTTSDIVQANLDRWQVEDRFRLSKDDELVGVSPVRHWTDSKIRCHLFTCVAAMTYLRRIELKLAAAGINRTAADIMQDMRRLHQVLSLKQGERKPRRRLETPSKTQAGVLSAFGYRVDASGVLQQTGR